MSKKTITPVVAIAGIALAGGMAISGMANAGENPFAAKGMSSGYLQVAEAEDEGKCGEGKCSGEKKSENEGKCSGEKPESEGKCGGSN